MKRKMLSLILGMSGLGKEHTSFISLRSPFRKRNSPGKISAWPQSILSCLWILGAILHGMHKRQFHGKSIGMGLLPNPRFLPEGTLSAAHRLQLPFSMDAVSILQESWESNCLHLSRQCISETEEIYTVALPESYTGPKLQCTGSEARITQEGNILALFVKGKEEQAEIKIR